MYVCMYVCMYLVHASTVQYVLMAECIISWAQGKFHLLPRHYINFWSGYTPPQRASVTTVKAKVAGSFNIFVPTYKTTWCHDTEDHLPLCYHCENLKWCNERNTWRIPSSGWRQEALVRTNLFEDHINSIIKVKVISEVGTLAVISNWRTLWRNTNSIRSSKASFLQQPHGTISQKMVFFIVTSVKASNLTNNYLDARQNILHHITLAKLHLKNTKKGDFLLNYHKDINQSPHMHAFTGCQIWLRPWTKN
jgi:hypothetical protein